VAITQIDVKSREFAFGAKWHKQTHPG